MRSRKASPLSLGCSARLDVEQHSDQIDEVAAAVDDAVDVGFPARQPRARMHAEHDLGAASAQLLDEVAILLERAVADFRLAYAHDFERLGDAQFLVDRSIDAGRVAARAQGVVA
jgi:hypothetical protein